MPLVVAEQCEGNSENSSFLHIDQRWPVTVDNSL